jgi:hypothetical protein
MNLLNTIATAFLLCYNLKSITFPANLDLVTTAINAFSTCYALETITNVDTLGRTTNTTVGTGMLTQCEQLMSFTSTAWFTKFDFNGTVGKPNKVTSIRLTNTSSTYGGGSPQINIRYCSLDATALNTLFGDLPTLTGKTIDVRDNPGTATCNTSIASAKGWTVTV